MIMPRGTDPDVCKSVIDAQNCAAKVRKCKPKKNCTLDLIEILSRVM